jgi:hypothetical protein
MNIEVPVHRKTAHIEAQLVAFENAMAPNLGINVYSWTYMAFSKQPLKAQPQTEVMTALVQDQEDLNTTLLVLKAPTSDQDVLRGIANARKLFEELHPSINHDLDEHGIYKNERTNLRFKSFFQALTHVHKKPEVLETLYA